MKLAGEQWAGAQAEQLDRLERFVCLTVIFRQSEKVFLLGRLEMLMVSFVKRTYDDPDVVLVGYVRFCTYVSLE